VLLYYEENGGTDHAQLDPAALPAREQRRRDAAHRVYESDVLMIDTTELTHVWTAIEEAMQALGRMAMASYQAIYERIKPVLHWWRRAARMARRLYRTPRARHVTILARPRVVSTKRAQLYAMKATMP
jgi:hypothetical protein